MKTLALPKDIISIGSLHITYYAVFILLGAITAYFIAAYSLKKKGYNFRILESVFYIAFPSGIVGARIWYVIAEWQKEFAAHPFPDIFEIWNGGLAIQGGVLLGAAVGILFVYYRRKNLPVLLAVDWVIPGVLVAQAIGRIGNFFNQEVYGQCVSRSEWSFLPSFILDQMSNIPNSGCVQGQIAVPLFLIEAISNLVGFAVIYFGIGYGLKKIKAPGDMACSYLIWYGLTRIIMEPMRNDQFIMGVVNAETQQKIMASIVMAWVFLIGGILGIIGCHLYDKFVAKPKQKMVEENFNKYIKERDEEI